MKHKTKRLFSGTLAVLMATLLLVSVFSPSASAADIQHDYRDSRKYKTTIRLTGREVENHYELNTKDLYLFSLEVAAPGDCWYGAVKVENTTESNMAIRVKSITSTLENDTTLFDALDLRISVAGETAYRGPYAASGSSVTDYYILNPGQVLFFDIKASFPGDADNACQGKQMDSTWTFDAVFLEPEQKLLDYTVCYIDQYFQNLLPEKLGHGYLNEVITEYAPEIDGYEPDAQIKQLVLTEDGHNVIYFIYYPEGTAALPEDPIDPPGTATPLDPSDDIIKTGFDLSSPNTSLFSFLSVFLLALLACTLTYLRLRSAKKVYTIDHHTEKKPHKTSQKEDA